MSYKALYRVYRPKTFSDVVGQKHIVAVLKSQVISGQVSHAYLFTGSRGTGKTSIAKIFARAISCRDNKEGEACLKCQLCTDSFNDTAIDIVEIDAASNNGVDEIRELRENVKFPPVMGRYKVYIIDEVHMLSTAAFNALLKTLEEPPAHVVFILATTEPQKLPETITSRCQRYDFERIGKEDIVGRLEYICKEESVGAQKDALLMLAEHSKGGLRDAISLLDQCIAFGEGDVTVDGVLNLLGKSNSDILFTIADLLIAREVAKLIGYINNLLTHGQKVTVLTGDIIEHLRKLMLFSTAERPEEIVSAVESQRYAEQSKRANVYMLLRGIKILSAAMADMRYSFLPVVILEVALMEICTPTADSDNFAIMERLTELEKAVKEGVKVIATQPQSGGAKPEVKKDQEEFDLPWDDDFMDIDAPPEEEGSFIMDEPVKQSAPSAQKPEIQKQPVEEKLSKVEDVSAKAEEVKKTKVSDKAFDGDFTESNYEEFVSYISKTNKGLYVSLKDSFFGGFEKQTLTIGYPDDSYEIFMSAVNAKKDVLIKCLAEMGFNDLKVCVKILQNKAEALNEDKTEDLQELFGDNIKFID